MDEDAIAAVRARVELELACGMKEIVARVELPEAAVAPRGLEPRASGGGGGGGLAGPGPGAASKNLSVSPVKLSAATRTAQAPPMLDPISPPLVGTSPVTPGSKLDRLAALKARVSPCTLCALAKGRTQTVFGTGDPDARLMFIGEGPGADEDRLGDPFVGRAGQLLDKIIEAMGLARQQVYIANVVKCRPPGNRVPQFEEVKACLPFLLEQIEIIRPELLVALGATAARALLDTTASMGSLRGRFFEFRGTPLLCTYHPAYLLRNPADKRKVWEDMQLAMKRLGLEAKRPAAPEPSPPPEA